MKAKLNIILCSILFAGLMSCSTGRYATAYNDDAYYTPVGGNNYDDYDDYYDGNYASSGVDINLFINTLNPYGRWMNYPAYGQVWICNEPGFIPYYSGGHWIYTTYGWTWASNYNWGWAPFHYGRWAYDAFYGWMWVPGYQWGPAWVGWRTGADYYGWAPLGPGVNINVGFSFGNIPADRWCFVPKRYVNNPNFSQYRVDRSRNTTIINNTTVINNTNVYNNTKYVVGPNRTEVEKVTGKRINALRVANDSKPGTATIVNNNTVRMFRPEIKRSETNMQEQRQMRAAEESKNVVVPQTRQLPDKSDNNIRNGNTGNRPDVKINREKMEQIQKDRIDNINRNSQPPANNDRRMNTKPDVNNNINRERMQQIQKERRNDNSNRVVPQSNRNERMNPPPVNRNQKVERNSNNNNSNIQRSAPQINRQPNLQQQRIQPQNNQSLPQRRRGG